MLKLFLVGLLVLSIAPAARPDSSKHRPKTVLVIYSNDRSLPANRQVDDALRETLAVNSNADLTYLTEYLDYPRYADEDDVPYDKLVSDFLRAKFSGHPIDVIVAGGPQAFRFMRRHQGDLFPNTPVLVIAVSQAFYEESLPSRFLAIPIVIDPRPTLEMAIRLQPDAKEIVVVNGASNFDLRWDARIRKTLTEWQEHPPVRYLSGLPMGDVSSELSHLPKNTIVYSPGMQRDGGGQTYSGRDSIRRMAQASSAPLYSSYSTMIDAGIVGGYVFEMADVGRQAGQIVRRLLVGERLSPKDMPDPLPSHYIVNWSQLERWHLPEASLPPGTTVVNRAISPWEQYKKYILTALFILALQLLLIVVLLLERRRRLKSQSQLAERLRFETLLAQVASSFSMVNPSVVDYPIQQCLRSVREFFSVDLASIWQFQQDSGALLRTHVSPEDAAIRIAVTLERLPNTVQRLGRGEIVKFSDEDERANIEDSEQFRDAGIKSFLAIPLQSDEKGIRVLSLIGTSKATLWPSGIVTRLRTIADILGNALARQNAARALRESEVLKGSILESLRSNVCVIDNTGFIIEVNQAWVDFALENDMPEQSAVGVGLNYLEICLKSASTDESMEARSGILSVLDGSRQIFEMEYACHSPIKQRWFRMTAMRLPRPEGGAVISHVDITLQKLAEIDQQNMQDEAAQMNRATEMGQLVASLAHELAQPLAAVLSNAQAAARLAARANPDLAEIKTALADIIEDDQRASAVLNHVRTILQKHTVVPHRVNLNDIVEDVILIVRNNAQLRGVKLRSALCPEAVLVRGDEVPLQQVLLNLVLNAMDAMAQLPAERKLLTLKTSVGTGNTSGLMVVEDEGPGVPDALQAKLFTPFFTTKDDGLGMGLPICAAILRSLGGSIEFQNRPEHGATFQVELPLAS
jgi:nitrogen-specific signal transduction histidine kinase